MTIPFDFGSGNYPEVNTPVSEKPKIINYQINDMCNSRCVMCNVWMRKRCPELSPDAFRTLLSDDLFNEVRHLGISGGEPTLRSDLDQFYKIALNVLPNLQGGHFITNGFNQNRALEIFSKVKRVYTSRGISFGGMVSLDGVGEVHDSVRGRQNAFVRTTSTLLSLRDAGISVMACCTVVKENVYALHDLLDWAKLNGIKLRFRIAEFIDRLYVDRTNMHIRSFEPHEVKHLVAFFHHLIHFYETESEVCKTYESILSLLTGGVRLTGCPYQSYQAISIDCEGRFSHCAPKGIPHAFGRIPGLDLLRFESDRKHMINKHCSQCIHDYHSDWSPSESAQRARSVIAYQELYGQKVDLTNVQESVQCVVEAGSLHHVLLVGWYGTETAGDIAILAGIVRKYAKTHPQARFTLLSLFPRYTAVTINDLPADLISRLKVFDYASDGAKLAANEADALVLAGGPLMDIPQTAMIVSLFSRFEKRNTPRIIESCGVGPLNIDLYRDNVIAIARLATEISVRDQDSAKYLRQWGIKKHIGVRPDPACDYIRSLEITWDGSNSEVITCFLRELTSEYPQTTSSEEAEAILIDFLKLLLKEFPSMRLELLSMHYFPIGNDDRLFARRVASKIGNERIAVPMMPMSPTELIKKMASSTFCVSMRFHSVVFAHTIAAPFIAIDYTAGGKIAGFLCDQDQEERCFDFEKLEILTADAIRCLVGNPKELPRNIA